MYTFFSRKMIIERNNKEHEVILEDLEKDVKNKWRWEWLQTCIDIDDPAKKYPKLNWTYGSLKMVVKDHIKKLISLVVHGVRFVQRILPTQTLD